MRRHDLNLLVILEAILREGSISAAARSLNLTQPAVSQALQRARAMFGDALMVRSGRGLMITQRGAALRSELAGVLDRVAGILAGPTFEPRRADRTFTIATSDLGEMILLPDALARLTAAAPSCRFEILPSRHDYSGDLPDVLLMGAAPPEGPWRWRDLFEDRFVLLARIGHPVLAGDLSPEAFAALQQVLVSPRGGGFNGPVDEALKRIGLKRHVAVSLPRFGTLPVLLSASDLVAAVPQRYAALPSVRSFCAWRPLPVPVPPFTMKLVWHLTRDGDPAQIWLRERLIGQYAGRS